MDWITIVGLIGTLVTIEEAGRGWSSGIKKIFAKRKIRLCKWDSTDPVTQRLLDAFKSSAYVEYKEHIFSENEIEEIAKRFLEEKSYLKLSYKERGGIAKYIRSILGKYNEYTRSQMSVGENIIYDKLEDNHQELKDGQKEIKEILHVMIANGQYEQYSTIEKKVEENQEKSELSLAERFIVGQDIETMQGFDTKAINDAFNAARQYYSSYITLFNNSHILCEIQLFQNVKAFDTSIRFVCSQEAYTSTCEYIIRERYLDVIEAVRYGCNYVGSMPSIFWEEEYQLSDEERRLIEKASKWQEQLTMRTIPDNEINCYSLFALLKSGYSFSDLYIKHYDIDSLVRFGIETDRLREYYLEDEIEDAVKRAEELFRIIESPSLGKYEKFGPNYLAKKFDAKAVLEIFPVEEICHAYSICDIIKAEPMVSAKMLKKGQYSAEELVEAGFSLRQLMAADFETERLLVKCKTVDTLNVNEIQKLVDDIIYELEEEEYPELFLCNSMDAELLRRLKEKGLLLGQIRNYLPFMIESCPCHVKWLLMAQYTIDELESEKIEWKEYFKKLPPEWIDNDEYEKYQYAGVLPLELFKSGIEIEQIESIYNTEKFLLDIEEIKGHDINTLREQGFTAKAFFRMGKTIEEVKGAYSCESEDDICEMALSWYDLRELRKVGFSLVKMKAQYKNILSAYDLPGDTSIWSRYGMIMDFLSKHGE